MAMESTLTVVLCVRRCLESLDRSVFERRRQQLLDATEQLPV
jgi:hypothetical protein